MSKNRLSALAPATVRGVAAGALCAVGLQLPVDFLRQLDSLLNYLRPLDLIPAYSAAWLAYLVLGGVAGGLIVLAVATAVTLTGRDSHTAVDFMTLWMIGLILTEVLVRGLRTYIEGPFLDSLRKSMGLAFPAANGMLILGLSIWLVMRHSGILLRLRGFLTVIALCGALAGGGTLLTALLHAIPDSPRSLADPKPRPPIVLITIDTLAANHMSLYGYKRETSPALDRLARQSVVFDGHHSNANVTTPSISSILTGVRPWVHRVFQLSASPLPGIAESGLLPAVQRAGYETLVVTTNVWASPMHQRTGRWVTQQAHGKSGVQNRLLNLIPHLDAAVFFGMMQLLFVACEQFEDNGEDDPEGAFEQARKLLSSGQSATPTFLWAHVFPPHTPYASPAPFLGRFEPDPRARKRTDSTPPFAFLAAQADFPGPFLGRYDEAILYVDDRIGRFLDWLRQTGRFDDAMIIVTADHGESFSHGYGTHAGPMLYEDVIHVPLLIKLPHQQDSRRISALTEHADILPTMLDYLGEPVPSHVEGRSLKAALEGATLEPRPVFSMDFEQNSVLQPIQTGSVAMLDGHYKYVTYFGEIKYPAMPKLEDALYDLQADPGETTNLILKAPERAARVHASIQAQLNAHSAVVK